ncbi:MAG: ABC transporter ATP-binding protein [Caldisphaera sp.]|nr:ABC transporter ATP-binding protein [Caldisphaera sp.]
MKILTIQNLVTKLPGFTLGPINLDIDEYEYYVLFGPNGSGKSTLLKTILGFYRPESGKIIVNNVDITKIPIEKRNIGYVPQSYSLFNNMSVKENLEFGLRVRKINKKDREEKINEVSEMLNIKNLLNKKSNQLSSGQQQLVSIARSLVTSPKLLLLDEPLSNLDPQVKQNIRKVLKKIKNSRKTTIIHVTHLIEDAYELSSNIIFLYKGRILEMGNSMDLFLYPKTKELAEYLGYINIFPAEIKKTNNDLVVSLDSNFNLKIRNDYYESENVFVAFRPQDVIIQDNILTDYINNNCFKGVIEDFTITSNGFLYTIKVSDKINIVFLSDKKFENGKKISFCIDPNKIRIVKELK